MNIEQWYIHITHRNKPKNRLYADVYAFLTGLDGFGVDNAAEHKEAILKTIETFNDKHPRTSPIRASWSKSKTETGKEMWMLHVQGIGYGLYKVKFNEE